MRRDAAGGGDGEPRVPGTAEPGGAGRDLFAVARHRMIEEQLTGRGIRDPRVLQAMEEIPRHRFVDPALHARAYGDHALPTAEGQTISQPWIVARMLELLAALGITNVALRHGDGTLGWQEFAPYARVLVSAAAPRVPDALRAQLEVGGVIVIPVGGPHLQHLEVWRRLPGDRWLHERHGECRFVPLVGRDAWRDAPESGH